MKKRKQSKTRLNTNPDVVKRIAFDFTHQELLTPTLVYVWNTEVDELEKLFDEVLGRLPFEFLEKYIETNGLPRFEIKPRDLFMATDRSLDAAFRELCHRSEHPELRKLETYIQLLLEAPCKSDECGKDCDEHYRNTNHAC
jgi:hypothetical protein